MKIDTELFNNFFLEQEKVVLSQHFSLIDNEFIGKIIVKTSKADLAFDVKVPKSFPYSNNQSCISFFCKDLIGYLHINSDNSVCIHTHFDTNPINKLRLEYQALLQWIQDFYIDEIEDKNYGYLLLNHVQKPINLLFHNDFNKSFYKSQRGKFEFSILKGRGIAPSLFLQKIDNQELKWNESIKKLEKLDGIWIFIEQEPIIQRRQPIENWQDLSKYFNNDLCQFVIGYVAKCIRLKKNYTPLLLLGYYITYKDKKEVHWNLIDISNIKYKIKKAGNFHYPSIENSIILWHKTTNCGYNRFFGRGKLTDNLTEKNILLVGCGAIGSNLANIFARGGVKKLTITDIDIVESGNLCRANYNLFDIGGKKSLTLKNNLELISPHINVNIEDFKKSNKLFIIEKSQIETSSFNDLKKYLRTFDIIFDCSVDEELSYLFDEMDLEIPIFNLSITNNAKELVCVTGNNLYEDKYHMLLHLPHEEAKFYEGLGCQYPTFEASHLDIQSLLMYALKNIEIQLDTNRINSFLITKNVKSASYEMNLYNYITYRQEDNDLEIKISEAIIKQIEQLSLFHYPNEFGGVFLGSYTDNKKCVIISEIIIPTKYISKENAFQIQGNSVNETIAKRFEETLGNLVYVGEWHTHPNSSSRYSPADLQAMKTIANHPEVTAKNPILLINGFNITNHNFTFYVYLNNQLYPYEKI
jgi:integrative and conjugative element protein (TIGR02256 family)